LSRRKERNKQTNRLALARMLFFFQKEREGKREGREVKRRDGERRLG